MFGLEVFLAGWSGSSAGNRVLAGCWLRHGEAMAVSTFICKPYLYYSFLLPCWERRNAPYLGGCWQHDLFPRRGEADVPHQQPAAPLASPVATSASPAAPGGDAGVMLGDPEPGWCVPTLGAVREKGVSCSPFPTS